MSGVIRLVICLVLLSGLGLAHWGVVTLAGSGEAAQEVMYAAMRPDLDARGLMAFVFALGSLLLRVAWWSGGPFLMCWAVLEVFGLLYRAGASRVTGRQTPAHSAGQRGDG